VEDGKRKGKKDPASTMTEHNMVDLTRGIDVEVAAETLGLKDLVDLESGSVKQENVPVFIRCVLAKLFPGEGGRSVEVDVNLHQDETGFTETDGSISFSVIVHSDLALESASTGGTSRASNAKPTLV
jgi:hypothetical protein